MISGRFILGFQNCNKRFIISSLSNLILVQNFSIFGQIQNYLFLSALFILGIDREAMLITARPSLPGRSLVRSQVGRTKCLRLAAANIPTIFSQITGGWHFSTNFFWGWATKKNLRLISAQVNYHHYIRLPSRH